jgi:hypothetical protein
LGEERAERNRHRGMTAAQRAGENAWRRYRPQIPGTKDRA